MSIFSNKKSFLSETDIRRIQQYERYEDIFDGEHKRVFANLQLGKECTYIPINIPHLISAKSADLLFGESPSYSVSEPDTQEAIDTIILNNDLHTICHEAAVTCAYKGDILFKVRFGKRFSHSQDNEVIIEVVQPDMYFPKVDPDNINNIISKTLAWKREFDGKQYIRVERHFPGKIENELWLSDDDWTMKEQTKLQDFYPDLLDEVATGIDAFLVIHIPNIKSGNSFLGDSDFKGLEPLFDEYNNRFSRISEILDKHTNPKLAVPEGIIGTNGVVYQKDMDLIEIPSGGTAPSYIVWDAQLTAAYSELDRILDAIFTVSEMSPSLFGKDSGGTAESGRALRYRLMNTLAKINRKRTYFDSGLKEVLWVSQLLDVKCGLMTYPTLDVDIQWSDGIPDDTQETSDNAIKLFNAGLISKRKAIELCFPGLSEDAVNEMIASIDGTVTPPADGLTV